MADDESVATLEVNSIADEQQPQQTELDVSNEANPLVARLKQIEARNTRKAATPAAENSASPSISEPKKNKPSRARYSAIEEMQLSLFQAETEGKFTSFPVAASSEHPTFLTRVPIFVPARRSNQRELLDDENSMVFETSWGAGKKYGPPLTVYDEDTLMAIGRLRSKRLAGRPHNMPLPVSAVHKEKNSDDVQVHIVHCMLSDIQKECGTSQGGKNNKLRLDSVKRLAAVTIELDTKTANKVVGRGTTVKLIDVAWQEYFDNAILYVQFSPIMAAWYEREYTYIDWNLRRKLHDTGKAIHRFLASQPKKYEIRTQILMRTIQYMRAYKYFMDDLKITLQLLEREGWIAHWEISGTGRSTPQKLSIQRL